MKYSIVVKNYHWNNEPLQRMIRCRRTPGPWPAWRVTSCRPCDPWTRSRPPQGSRGQTPRWRRREWTCFNIRLVSKKYRAHAAEQICLCKCRRTNLFVQMVAMEVFIKRGWRLHRLKCLLCLWQTLKIMQHSKIPNLFDFWADHQVLLLKRSTYVV